MLEVVDPVIRILALSVLAACGPSDGPGPDGASGPAALMDFTRPTLYAAPFPADDLLRAGGVDLSKAPNPDGVPYGASVLDALAGVPGFGRTSGIFFTFDRSLGTVALGVHDTVAADAPVRLVALEGPDAGTLVPVDVRFQDFPGPFADPWLLSLVPLQGYPLHPSTRYAAVVLQALGDDSGAELRAAPQVLELARGEVPAGMTAADAASWTGALHTLEELGVPAADIASFTVFTTWDPVADFAAVVADAAARPVPAPLEPWVLTDTFDDYCVFETTVAMPVYQQGEPPYTTGGGWTPGSEGGATWQRDAVSRLWLTVPRAAPAGPLPVAVMSRTGGGGDNPLVERGPRLVAGGSAAEPGTGPALTFARAGWVGMSVDGPHGGPRNVTGGDEQFLMFNIPNPLATRDNVRQSALELALLPDIADGLDLDASACPGAPALLELDTASMALMGHSMGATIAPLVLAVQPRFGAAILSGAGGSYIHNIVHKLSPIEVRPIADALLNYPARGLTLHEHDPFLSLVQWAAEPADPPTFADVAAEEGAADVLMVQGIVDTYILPPMANATSLSLGLDLAGPALDEGDPRLDAFASLESVLELVGGRALDLPLWGNGPRGGTRVVVQQLEDGIEDGHEVVFQTEPPKHQLRCFLESHRAGEAVVVVGGAPEDPCSTSR